MLSSFSRVQTVDRTENQLQDNIANALNPVIKNPLIDGTFLTGIALASGTNTVNHTLGRTLLGWIITRSNAGVTIHDTQATNPLPALTLQLTSSAPVTVNIYVF